MAVSDQKIEEVLTSNSMEKLADDPSTMDQIKEGFDKSFAMVKDKLGDSWQDVRAIYDMIMDKDFEVDKQTKYISIGALVYLISPVDLLPERFMGPLGLADDVAVLMWSLNKAKPEIARYAEFKANQEHLVEGSQTGTADA